MADKKHVHGEMDITTQEKTFDGFMAWVSWAVVIILVSLVLLYLING